jgi:hypothetical protein
MAQALDGQGGMIDNSHRPIMARRDAKIQAAQPHAALRAAALRRRMDLPAPPERRVARVSAAPR